jgi:hypothetical protein
MLRDRDKIARERPELYKKIAGLDEISLEDTFSKK